MIKQTTPKIAMIQIIYLNSWVAEPDFKSSRFTWLLSDPTATNGNVEFLDVVPFSETLRWWEKICSCGKLNSSTGPDSKTFASQIFTEPSIPLVMNMPLSSGNHWTVVTILKWFEFFELDLWLELPTPALTLPIECLLSLWGFSRFLSAPLISVMRLELCWGTPLKLAMSWMYNEPSAAPANRYRQSWLSISNAVIADLWTKRFLFAVSGASSASLIMPIVLKRLRAKFLARREACRLQKVRGGEIPDSRKNISFENCNFPFVSIFVKNDNRILAELISWPCIVCFLTVPSLTTTHLWKSISW